MNVLNPNESVLNEKIKLRLNLCYKIPLHSILVKERLKGFT